jgi:hypothetical protein
MSIQNRRPAAGQQWTAAHIRKDAFERGLRGKRLATWVLIVPTLAFFSLGLVNGARALGKPTIASAAKELPRNEPLVVVAGANHTIDNFLPWFSKQSAKELCSVTRSQLALIAERYQVGHVTVTIDGVARDIVTISGKGANDHDLRTYLGDAKLKCKLVRNGGMFFLPFDGHGS